MTIDTEHPNDATVLVSQRRDDRRWTVTYQGADENFVACGEAIKHSVELNQVRPVTIVILPPVTLPSAA